MSVIALRSTRYSKEIERVYRERLNVFVSVANAILHDEQAARDAVQEAFASAVKRQSSFKRGDIEAWIWRIVVNSALSARRTQQRTGQHEQTGVDWAIDSHGGTEASPSSEREDVRGILGTLSERQRLVVFLRHYADLDYKAIATALDVKSGTVAATLHAAHAALRREMREVAR